MTTTSLSVFPRKFPFRFTSAATIPAGTPHPPNLSPVISQQQLVSIHTVTGTQLYQFLSNQLLDLTWTRESRTDSRCDLTIPATVGFDRMPDIHYWLHWVSVWDDTGQNLYWTGPITQIKGNRTGLKLSCRDIAALFDRTRCPISKRWDATDPADIANELLAAMIELHGLTTKPRVRRDPFGDKFDYTATGDASMLKTAFDDLTRFGLHWSVVAGQPLLGPMPRTAVASLREDHFSGGGVTVVRDGSKTYNDILLRGADALSRARVPMGGLNLQTIVNVDNAFGVSNVDRAVKQYARYVSKVRDSISMPDDAVLTPNAPVSIDQLVPSARITVEAFGLLIPMELHGVDVRCTPAESTVSVRLTAVDDDLPELIDIQDKSSITGGAR